MGRNKKKEKFVRISSVLISLFILSLGILHLLAGHLHYLNYRGALVFSPFTIVIGLFMLYVAIFKWDKINGNTNTKKPKIKSDHSFISVLIGMSFGLIGGFLFLFNLDTTKGYNPYGWWVTGTLLATVICGLLGPIVYKNLIKNKG